MTYISSFIIFFKYLPSKHDFKKIENMISFHIPKNLIVQKLCLPGKTRKINVLFLTRFAKMLIQQFVLHIF